MRCVTRANAGTRAAKRGPAGSMPSATLSATRSSASVRRTSQETLRLNVFGSHPPATAPRTVPNQCNAQTASVCHLATLTRTVPSMSAVCKDFACVSHHSRIMSHHKLISASLTHFHWLVNFVTYHFSYMPGGQRLLPRPCLPQQDVHRWLPGKLRLS